MEFEIYPSLLHKWFSNPFSEAVFESTSAVDDVVGHVGRLSLTEWSVCCLCHIHQVFNDHVDGVGRVGYVVDCVFYFVLFLLEAMRINVAVVWI